MKFTGRGILKFLFCLLFFAVVQGGVFSQEEKTTIRVGLSNQGFLTFEHKSASFVSPDVASLSDLASNTQLEIAPDEVIDVKIEKGLFSVSSGDKKILEEAKGPLVITPKEKTGIVNLNRKGTPAFYSGLIELKSVKENTFNIINVLDMQTYLKGVVPNEMPVSFGLEALKAQAVAARNYANRPQNVYKNYDICDSTACQVYYGINSQKEISDKAVDETKGIFALYENEPILALYSSTAGGITEDWKNVYGYNNPSIQPKPYLVSVCDDKNQKFLKTEDEVREFYSNKTLSYDVKSPRYRWQVEWETLELEEVLNKTLLEQSKAGLVEPKFDGSFVLEGLEDIKVLKRGNSGKALEIEIVFKNGTYKVKRELGIRRVLKKNNAMLASANFFVDKELKPAKKDNLEIPDDSKSEAVFSFEKLISPMVKHPKSPQKFIITGGGFGHGVGMSQYGAGYMASLGKKYDEILKHYYSSITLGTMHKEVAYNPYQIQYKSEFYRPKNSKQRYILKVSNPKRVSTIKFSINSHNFNPDMTGYSAKVLGMDITKYLKDGVNTVIFEPLDAKDKSKTLTYQIEVINRE